jgi:RNA polymerase sigma-70 factor (ECF subfamily)
MLDCVATDGDRIADAGEPLDFEALFRLEFPAIARTTYLIVHDHAVAEEIAQDAFLQLFRKWARVSRYERPGAWVRRVALRMAVRAAQREGRRPNLEQRAIGVAPGEGATRDDEVLAAVSTLAPMQRAAVVLHYFEDRPVAEVADLLRCSPATAKVHLHRARHRLADLLGEEVDDDA